MADWVNNDGLYIKFGTSEGTSAHKAGQYNYADGGIQVIEFDLVLATLTETETIVNDAAPYSKNSQLIWVETETVVAATAGTAIDVGLVRASDRTTEIDYDGFLAAFPTAEMAQVGEVRRYYETHTIPATMTGTGAIIGQENPTYVGLVTASRTDATAFTAGKVRIKLGVRMKGIDNF